jgi:uncharacterized membrane protein YeaQ/YmgE (transglycosylase-associated protein family)
MNYLTGVVVVTTGIVLGFFAKNVNSILQWIVSGLYGGYIAANVLKWYWWRFNANGYFYGMLAGIAGALVFSKFFEGVEFLYFFPVLFALSLGGCLLGTYTAPPTDAEILKNFYKTVRPWGFWKPVHEMVMAEDISFQPNKRFKLDMFNVAIGIIGQLCLTVLPMYLVLWMKLPLLITVIILAVIIIILKKTWWNKLEN